LKCEVLVIGAGPAGCAAARTLAQNGVDVLLIDQHPLGRDKVCGDGLIPDAHAALRKLGLWNQVADQALHLPTLECIGPRGGHIKVPGQLAVLPRQVLDKLLCLGAQDAGVRFASGVKFQSTIQGGSGTVCGAHVEINGNPHEINAKHVILATGAQSAALTAANLCERTAPSAVALRCYIEAPSLAADWQFMSIVWSQLIRPGYGWIFPGPNGIFNVGIGLFNQQKVNKKTKPATSHKYLPLENQDHAREHEPQRRLGNLRNIFERFIEQHPPLVTLLQQGKIISEVKGAPLRCGLTGARWSRPGLLAIGDAIGSTYAFTGEGIGKAMETGILAAEALIKARQQNHSPTQTCLQYEQGLHALLPQFNSYARANSVNEYPWLVDVVIWRAQKSPRLRQSIASILSEQNNPGRLFTLKGVKRLLLD